MAKVSLRKIEKEYPNGFKAVHGIDLEIKDGEFMVFVGPSGCAKSTTLRMIAGLEQITGGEIYIDDNLVNDVEPKDRGIAMVFQNYALYPHMSVYDNMAFGLKLRKMKKEEIDRRVKIAAEKLEITDLLDRKPKEMSGGQRQRVALGRAIVREPKVFLFDEPLSNLDAKLRMSMRVKITQLHQDLKATMIYVTHDQVEAMTMGDRITVLNLGRIMQVDTPLNLYHKPKNVFVASFIGSPTMNLFEAKLVEENGDVFVQAQGTKILLPRDKSDKLKNYINKDIIFGLRPENICKTDVESPYTAMGDISVVEQMGNEEYIYFNIGDIQLSSRITVDGYSEKITGPHLFYFDTTKCHIFDKETENNIIL